MWPPFEVVVCKLGDLSMSPSVPDQNATKKNVPKIGAMSPYPNWSAYVGSGAPMITALLGNIGVAGFLAALQSAFVSKELTLLVGDVASRDAVMILGIFSTLCFVATTISLIFLQASDFESLTNEKQERIFINLGLKEETHREEYSWKCIEKAGCWFDCSNLLALSGISLLILTLASLIYGHVRLASCVIGFISVIISVSTIFYKSNLTTPKRRLIACITGVVLTFLSLGFFVSTILSTAPSP